MKKVLLLLLVLNVTYNSYAQTPVVLKESNLNSKAYVSKNKLEPVLRLYGDQKSGISYFEDNQIHFLNAENGIKKLYINSADLSRLNKPFRFSESIEMLLIKITDLDFDLDRIDCSKLSAFKSLKYVFYIIETKLDTQKKLSKPNCFSNVILQYIKIEIPS
ncbi:hypothetical protein ES677_12315 [Bizionia gelidisalsuginis]|uniref:Uncharacterized protein n=1 Tax=Bizionia gelidisalsuginis TaxID=291188 RepID=A0ABY3M8B4_9FLAO|nr:hypothetical protein [Bizionia gelidisalsuginis]TYC10145.1 hypothetical protein ES677_12315 [Bizionia gelidisalsuginis]